MIAIPARHRRPGCQWHTNMVELSEVRHPRRRRIRLALDDGDVAIELTPERAIQLCNEIADILEGAQNGIF